MWKENFTVSNRKSVFTGNFITRVLLSAAGGQNGACSYLMLCLSSHGKTYCACWKKRERERYVCCFFLFVTGFTKLCFNKLFELLSSILCCLVGFIWTHKQSVMYVHLNRKLKEIAAWNLVCQWQYTPLFCRFSTCILRIRICNWFAKLLLLKSHLEMWSLCNRQTVYLNSQTTPPPGKQTRTRLPPSPSPGVRNERA